MKVLVSKHIYDHPWDAVSVAAWRKYPNPHKPEIMGTDIVERSINDGVLHSQRLITSRFGLPSWSRKLLGSEDVCYGYEKSQVDPSKQVMRTQTRNVTFASTVTMGERISYTALPPTPENPDKPRTLLVQESTVQVHGLPFTDYLEDTILRSITRNNFKGREAMEWTINHIKQEEKEQFNANSISKSDPLEGTLTKCVVDEVSDQAIKSMDQIGSKALQSVDQISCQAKRSVDDLSEKAMSSLKSVDEISEKAKQSLKSVDGLSERALRSALRPPRVFDEIFNLFL